MAKKTNVHRIPTEADWGDYCSDLDQKWAHDQYINHSNDEMQKYFRNSPIEASSDLEFMPEIPFRYYMLGYRDLVMSVGPDDLFDSDAASCFLNLVTRKLKNQPKYIVPIMSELVAALEFVANIKPSSMQTKISTEASLTNTRRS